MRGIFTGVNVSTSLFEEIAPGIGIGSVRPPEWYDLADFPLIILVGVTGVGKSTTIEAMQETLYFTLMPNRRTLTDQLIIAEMQREDGQGTSIVMDREARFDYTRRYREMYAGGMAHALAQLSIDVQQHETLLVFDGLRGVNEVSYAAESLPSAIFVLLEAPDHIRVQRLLGRNDSFDQIRVDTTEVSDKGLLRFADIGVSSADSLFTVEERRQLLALVERGKVEASEMAAKLRIVVAERRNYDPAATRAALIDLAPTRTLAIDTTRRSPAEAAERIAKLF